MCKSYSHSFTLSVLYSCDGLCSRVLHSFFCPLHWLKLSCNSVAVTKVGNIYSIITYTFRVTIWRLFFKSGWSILMDFPESATSRIRRTTWLSRVLKRISHPMYCVTFSGVSLTKFIWVRIWIKKKNNVCKPKWWFVGKLFFLIKSKSKIIAKKKCLQNSFHPRIY